VSELSRPRELIETPSFEISARLSDHSAGGSAAKTGVLAGSNVYELAG
jgi:hypothetical protein